MSRRRVAEALARQTVRIMPRERRDWALGIIAELAHIEEDGAALAFAAGGFRTACLHHLAQASSLLRLGRLGVAGGTAALGLTAFALAPKLQAASERVGSVEGPALGVLLLGTVYLGAAWSLARSHSRVFSGLVACALAAVAIAAVCLTFADLSAHPHGRFLLALTAEAFVLLTLLGGTGLFLLHREGALGSRPAA